ncbi:DUF2514 family protein [Pseudomonas sp. GV071]|uniref:DUF2514 family protein n=1 Tax=Pseudomonas sp. GV071 TaxID=2135754 RepID=UPI00353208B4
MADHGDFAGLNAVLLKALPYLLAAGLAFAALFGAYTHGVTVTDNKWKAANADQALLKAKGLAAETGKARTTEQGWQQNSNQVGKDARVQIAAAAADGIVADAAGDGVRDAAIKLAAAAGNVSCDTGAIERGAAATRAAMVLSELFQRADKRAGELAKAFDQSRIAAMACEASYDAIAKSID